jgi:hypothetical protein
MRGRIALWVEASRRQQIIDAFRQAGRELEGDTLVPGELTVTGRADQGVVIVLKPHAGRAAYFAGDGLRVAAWTSTIAGELARRAGVRWQTVTVTVTV